MSMEMSFTIALMLETRTQTIVIAKSVTTGAESVPDHYADCFKENHLLLQE